MSLSDIVVIPLHQKRYDHLGDELHDILGEYRDRKIDAAMRAAIEARVSDACLRYAHENGLDPRLARVFVLESTLDPSELLVADEGRARAAISSGHWLDPCGRFRDDAPMSERPVFSHDCAACTYLGHFRAHDLYFCTQHGLPTVIARYGHAGPEYTSGMALAEVDPVLGEARSRARERGLCT